MLKVNSYLLSTSTNFEENETIAPPESNLAQSKVAHLRVRVSQNTIHRQISLLNFFCWRLRERPILSGEGRTNSAAFNIYIFSFGEKVIID